MKFEKEFKRWIKNKVSFSIATLVAFLITGTAGYAGTVTYPESVVKSFNVEQSRVIIDSLLNGNLTFIENGVSVTNTGVIGVFNKNNTENNNSNFTTNAILSTGHGLGNINNYGDIQGQLVESYSNENVRKVLGNGIVNYSNYAGINSVYNEDSIGGSAIYTLDGQTSENSENLNFTGEILGNGIIAYSTVGNSRIGTIVSRNASIGGNVVVTETATSIIEDGKRNPDATPNILNKTVDLKQSGNVISVQGTNASIGSVNAGLLKAATNVSKSGVTYRANLSDDNKLTSLIDTITANTAIDNSGNAISVVATGETGVAEITTLRATAAGEVNVIAAGVVNYTETTVNTIAVARPTLGDFSTTVTVANSGNGISLKGATTKIGTLVVSGGGSADLNSNPIAITLDGFQTGGTSTATIGALSTAVAGTQVGNMVVVGTLGDVTTKGDGSGTALAKSGNIIVSTSTIASTTELTNIKSLDVSATLTDSGNAIMVSETLTSMKNNHEVSAFGAVTAGNYTVDTALTGDTAKGFKLDATATNTGNAVTAKTAGTIVNNGTIEGSVFLTAGTGTSNPTGVTPVILTGDKIAVNSGNGIFAGTGGLTLVTNNGIIKGYSNNSFTAVNDNNRETLSGSGISSSGTIAAVTNQGIIFGTTSAIAAPTITKVDNYGILASNTSLIFSNGIYDNTPAGAVVADVELKATIVGTSNAYGLQIVPTAVVAGMGYDVTVGGTTVPATGVKVLNGNLIGGLAIPATGTNGITNLTVGNFDNSDVRNVYEEAPTTEGEVRVINGISGNGFAVVNVLADKTLTLNGVVLNDYTYNTLSSGTAINLESSTLGTTNLNLTNSLINGNITAGTDAKIAITNTKFADLTMGGSSDVTINKGLAKSVTIGGVLSTGGSTATVTDSVMDELTVTSTNAITAAGVITATDNNVITVNGGSSIGILTNNGTVTMGGTITTPHTLTNTTTISNSSEVGMIVGSNFNNIAYNTTTDVLNLGVKDDAGTLEVGTINGMETINVVGKVVLDGIIGTNVNDTALVLNEGSEFKFEIDNTEKNRTDGYLTATNLGGDTTVSGTGTLALKVNGLSKDESILMGTTKINETVKIATNSLVLQGAARPVVGSQNTFIDITVKNNLDGIDGNLNNVYQSVKSSGMLGSLAATTLLDDKTVAQATAGVRDIFDQTTSNNPYALSALMARESMKIFRDQVSTNTGIKPAATEFVVQGAGIYNTSETKSNGYTGDTDTYGGYGIVEYGITDDMSVGAVIGGASQDGNLDKGSNVDGTAMYLGFFGRKSYTKWEFMAGLDLQIGSYDAKRVVSNGYDTFENSQKYDSRGFGLNFETRYLMEPISGFKFEPKAKITLSSNLQDSINEGYNSSEIGIKIDEERTFLADFEIGVDALKSLELTSGRFDFRTGVSLLATAGDTSQELTGRIVGERGNGSTFDVEAFEIPTVTGKVGVGVDYIHQNGVMGSLGVEYQGGSDYSNLGVKLGLGYKF